MNIDDTYRSGSQQLPAEEHVVFDNPLYDSNLSKSPNAGVNKTVSSAIDSRLSKSSEQD